MDGSVSDLMVSDSTFVYGDSSTSSITEGMLLQGVGLNTKLLLTPLTASTTTAIVLVNESRVAVSSEPHINSFFTKFPPAPYSVHLTLGFIMTLVGIVAVVGNLFIIYVFYR